MVNDFKDMVAIHTSYGRAWDFTFTRKREQGLFYAYYLGTNEDSVDAFWTIKTSPQLIKDAESRVIDMRTFLTSPHACNEVRIETSHGESVRLNLEVAIQLYEDSLPYKDIYLRTPKK